MLLLLKGFVFERWPPTARSSCSSSVNSRTFSVAITAWAARSAWRAAGPNAQVSGSDRDQTQGGCLLAAWAHQAVRGGPASSICCGVAAGYPQMKVKMLRWDRMAVILGADGIRAARNHQARAAGP